MPLHFVQWVYWSAASINIFGVFLLSKGLSNSILMNEDPTLFSSFGLCMIMIWGGCYYACTDSARSHYEIGIIFAIEKTAYVVMWFRWVFGETTSLFDLIQQDLFAGIFYAIYGIIDFSYALLFIYIAYHVYHSTKSEEKLKNSNELRSFGDD